MSIGLKTKNASIDCKDDDGPYSKTNDVFNEYVDFRYVGGLGNGLSFEAYLASNVDTFLDDRQMGLGFNKVFGSNLGISGYYGIHETDEDLFYSGADYDYFKVSANFYF